MKIAYIFSIILIAGSFASHALDGEAISSANLPAVVITLGENAKSLLVQGSGCVVGIQGFILSTAHQVLGLTKLRVQLSDGTVLPVRIESFNEKLDIALLNTDTPLPKSARIGSARRLKMGSPLLAISSPLGLNFSAAGGLVSSVERSYHDISVLQVDLPVSSGSSGGPVFDEDGLLVGIIMGRVEGAQGVTLVNPVDNAYPMLIELALMAGPSRTMEDRNAEFIPAENISQKDLAALRAYNQGVRLTKVADKIPAYQRAVELLPDLFEGWFNLGVAFTEPTPQRAIESYRVAQRLRPDSIAVYRNLGRLYLQTDQFASAIETFTRAVELRPDQPSCHNDLGEAYRLHGDNASAENAFKRATGLDWAYSPAHYNLALLFASVDANAAASAEFKEYLRLEPGAMDRDQVLAWIREAEARVREDRVRD